MATWLRMSISSVLLAGIGCYSDGKDPTELADVSTHFAGIVTVGTCDSPQVRVHCRGDCHHDEVQINAAIASVRDGGGVVKLLPGTYDLQRSDSIGAVVISRSDIVLEGSGPSTRLVLADHQNVNAVAIHGLDIKRVVVRDLYVHGNRFKNNPSEGSSQPRDPWDNSGIRAKPFNGSIPEDIRVENCWVEESYRLNIQLIAINAVISDCWLGDATMDVAEIIIGPGRISNNFVEIDGVTGYGLGTDKADDVIIESNQVVVRDGGRITQEVFRFWPHHQNNALISNSVRVEEEGYVEQFVRLAGRNNIMSGNQFHSNRIHTKIVIEGPATVVNANLFANTHVIVDQKISGDEPILIYGNVWINSPLTVLNGRVNP